jgi:hypothetical protein
LYIQHFPKFIMFIAELASRVINTIFLFSEDFLRPQEGFGEPLVP